MDDFIPFRLDNRNTYLFVNKYDFKYTLLVNPSLISFLDKTSENDNLANGINYYQEKARYLRNKLPDVDHSYNGRLHPEQVKDYFRNATQIVFEVTDSCNLNCMYCGYGELYSGYDKRQNNYLKYEDILPLFSYLNDLKKEKTEASFNDMVYISFYGGEPLMNMKFIKQIVEYIHNNKDNNNHNYAFSMTTNAILLCKYMDYLVDNNFKLLISLDGDKNNNAYRINRNGSSSFDRICKNIDALREKYPLYFDEYVNFNSVLHNKNSVGNIYNFIHDRYNKTPRISELNNTNIIPSKKKEFDTMYRNRTESLQQSENYEELEHNLFTLVPSYYNACNFLHAYNSGVIKTYNDFFFNMPIRYIPTGTCIPFSKKIFITVNGRILPCERISHSFSLGQISSKGLQINFEEIAVKYNMYYDKLEKQCSKCFLLGHCIQCLFNLDRLDTNPQCYGFMNKKKFVLYLAGQMAFFEKHPEDYYRIMEEIVLK